MIKWKMTSITTNAAIFHFSTSSFKTRVMTFLAQTLRIHTILGLDELSITIHFYTSPKQKSEDQSPIMNSISFHLLLIHRFSHWTIQSPLNWQDFHNLIKFDPDLAIMALDWFKFIINIHALPLFFSSKLEFECCWWGLTFVS
jgi:hypothetical protein